MRADGARICLLAEAFYPAGGGVGTNGMAVGAALAARGCRVLVLTRRTRADLPARETLRGVRIERLPPASFRRFGKYLCLGPLFGRLAALRREYDLIYVWGIRILGAPAVLAGRALGKPVLLRASETGDMPGHFLTESAFARRHPWLRPPLASIVAARNRIMRGASCFVATSAAVQDSYEREGVPGAAIWRIPNGVDPARFAPAGTAEKAAARRRLGLSEGTLFVFTGRLHRSKGLATLVRAWGEVATRRPDAHLALVGGDSPHLGCEAELRQAVEALGLRGRVTFAGEVEDVLAYLQAADCFVLPSEAEAFPLALLEAMACGLPAISTRTGGGVELVRAGETGLLTPIGDAAALRDALLFMTESPAERRRMGEAARRVVTAEYSLERCVERHLELFEGALAGTGARSR